MYYGCSAPRTKSFSSVAAVGSDAEPRRNEASGAPSCFGRYALAGVGRLRSHLNAYLSNSSQKKLTGIFKCYLQLDIKFAI